MFGRERQRDVNRREIARRNSKVKAWQTDLESNEKKTREFLYFDEIETTNTLLVTYNNFQ